MMSNKAAWARKGARLLKSAFLLLSQLDFALQIAKLSLQLSHLLLRRQQLLLAPSLPLRQPQQRRLLHKFFTSTLQMMQSLVCSILL
jgi:hypothetical protein